MSVTPLDGFVLNGSEYEMRDKLAQARIDNLVAQNNPTDGNTELLDIRVGADGHTYDSAGQAIREQIQQVSGESQKNFLSIHEELYSKSVSDIEWKQGGVVDDGTELTGNISRIRTVFIDGTKQRFRISCLIPNYQFIVCRYAERDLLTFISNTPYGNEEVVTEKGYWYAIIVKHIDGTTTITPELGYDIISVTQSSLFECENKISNVNSLVVNNSKKIDGIYEVLPKKLETVSLDINYNSYWDYTGEQVEFTELEGSYAAFEPIEVCPNEQYKITIKQGSGLKGRSIILVDEFYQVVYSYQPDVNVIVSIEDFDLFIPENAKYLLLTQYGNRPTKVYKVIQENVLGKSELKELEDISVWSGLNVSLLGGSMSTFKNFIPPENKIYYTGNNHGVSDVSQMWWYNAIKGLGGTPLIIDAWSGSCVTSGIRNDSEYKPSVNPERCQNLHSWVKTNESSYDLEVTSENIGALRKSPFLDIEDYNIGDHLKKITPDIVLVAMGGNDYSYESEDGKLGVWDGHTILDSKEITTFREAYANMISNIHEYYPDALVICLSLPFIVRGTTQSLGDKRTPVFNTAGHTQKDFDDAIKDIALLLQCEFVNGNLSGFNRQNYYGEFCSDSNTTPTHPTALGQTILGNTLKAKFKSIAIGYIEWLKSKK